MKETLTIKIAPRHCQMEDPDQGQISYIYNTDLLDFDQAQIIAHQCNCTSKTAKGLAKLIFDKYPYTDVYSSRESPSTPGTISVTGGKAKGRWVCAMFAQIYPGKFSSKGNPPDTASNRKKWFQECLSKIAKIKNIRSVAFPEKIGCGLAGGDWDNYLEMLDNFASANPNIKVYVVSKDPEPVNEPTFTVGFFQNLILEMETAEESSINLEEVLRRCEVYNEALENPVEDEKVIPGAAPEEPPTWLTTSLLEYTEGNIPAGWEEFFNAQLDVDFGSLYEISKYLVGETHRQCDIYPNLADIYNAFCILPEDVKVVIVGQDPFFNPDQAMGICFSVPDGIDPPPSLKNIYKELVDDGFTVSDFSKGDLRYWCAQGVLMLNTALTVRAHEPASHSAKWLENFTPSLMRFLDRVCQDLVVVLWGGHAQSFGKFFGTRHKKIQSAHPSPLSAHRGFFGSKPFSKINHQLELAGREIIDWSL